MSALSLYRHIRCVIFVAVLFSFMTSEDINASTTRQTTLSAWKKFYKKYSIILGSSGQALDTDYDKTLQRGHGRNTPKFIKVVQVLNYTNAIKCHKVP